MAPEENARELIDAQLTRCGWTVQTKNKINLSASRGVAICELSFATGEPDYTLFGDGKAICTTEAKPEGETLTGVEEQSAKYVFGVPFGLAADFHNDLADVKAFSERNLKLMTQFFREYPDFLAIGQPPVARLDAASNAEGKGNGPLPYCRGRTTSS